MVRTDSFAKEVPANIINAPKNQDGSLGLNSKEKVPVRKHILVAAFLAFSSLLAAQQILNNDSIIKLVKAGFSDDMIVATVNGVPGSYDTSADGLIALKAAGVSEKVVAAIVAKGSAPAHAPAPAASDLNDPASPHDPGIYMMLSDSAGKPRLVRLEQKESDTEPPMMFSSVKAKIPGARADLRTSESKPVFYLYFPSTSGITDSADPSQFPLLTLAGKGDHREVEVAHRKTVANGYVFVTGLNKSTITASSAERLRPHVYKVTPNDDLKPGEYAFIAAMKLNETGSASFFDFGVDSK